MAVKWKEFESYIKPDMTGCPRKVVADAARRAAIEFCEETQLWEMVSEPSAIIGGHAVYTPDAPDDAEVTAIIKAVFVRRDEQGNELSRTELQPLNDSDLSRMGNWESLKDRAPRYYRTYEPARVQLIPAPTETLTDALVMTVAVKPAHNAKTCPQFLLSSHAAAIGFGAKRDLASIPNKTWSNLGKVDSYRREFQNKINMSRRNKNTANSRKSLRVQAIRFI
ncbi:hypothetical protein [Maridesulfovibrio sp.]|uniref:hypothetical protein n=1 Tax=Maridesulfovibrio sp. TaxID=2795000 RepID=UPI0029C9FDAA|nr:hypothetical protein [Maridesulfovibrio sp.]